MAQTGYTPIQLYQSSTAANVPTSGSLLPGELAINTADGKLFYKDSSGTVQVIASKSTGSIGGANTYVQYNNANSLAGSANLTFNGTTLGVTGNITATNVYANSGTVGASLLTGTVTTNAQPNITSVGTLSLLSVTGNISGANLTGTHYGAATGLTSIPTGNLSGTVSVTNGGTGVTTLTGIVKASGTSAFTAAVAGTDYLTPANVLQEKKRIITASTATTAIDLNTGDNATVFKVTIAASTTITFSNYPAAPNGETFTFTLMTVNDATAGRSMVFGNTIKWAGGILPPRTTAANAIDIWTFFVENATYYGSLSMLDMK